MLLAGLLALIPCSSQEVTAAQDYHVMSAIEYVQGSHGPLLADAYLPNQPGPHPGILFIHGGGWSSGDRNQMVRLIKDLAVRGYVGFTIDYDLTPTLFPAARDQALQAVQYLRQHSKALDLDPTRLVVAGSSAGGELAALVALTPAAHLQGAVILNGVLDLVALGDASKMVTNYLGSACTVNLKACQEASPTNQVHPGAPPFYVGHGTADQTVPYLQAEQFVASLRADKVPVQPFIAQDGPHTYWAKDAYYQRNLTEILAFLEHLPSFALSHSPHPTLR